MEPALARKSLMAARAAVGWSSLLFPTLVLRLFGVKGHLRGELKYALRLFGIRDVLLGYQLYQAEREGAHPDELEEALRQGIVVDAVDTASAMVLGVRGGASARTVLMGAAAAGAAAGLGMMGREGQAAGSEATAE